MIDWEEVKVNASISALQGILESGKVGEVLELMPNLVAKQSVRLANSLVEELKRNKDNASLEREINLEIEKMFKKDAK